MIKYYKSKHILIQHNTKTNIIRLRNTINNNKILFKDEFDLLEKEQIKKDEFSRLMNIYFKSIKHSWDYHNEKFKKLPNFESNGYKLITNYDLLF